MEYNKGGNFSSLLDIYVHEAINLHNICIYANQDVYAKFSLTSTPDDALSTRVVASGGNCPRFNEQLPPLRIPHPSDKAVLKVEIYMLSCAKTLLGDQLLGFTLIPIPSIISNPKPTKTKTPQSFTLSSTDLFHSPAGTIRLTLNLNPQPLIDQIPVVSASITSEVVILDPVVDYNNIEFPDVNVAQENQEMVREYFDMGVFPAQQSLPFIQLTRCVSSVNDCEMVTVNPTSEDNNNNNNNNNTVRNNITNFTGSTVTSSSHDNRGATETLTSSSVGSPDTPTSKEATGEKQSSAFNLPLKNMIPLEEPNEMQKQIMEMYMKSMQQFTESLAKMKLPMDIDKAQMERRDVSKSSESKNTAGENKKDGCRVFYGSRAFF